MIHLHDLKPSDIGRWVVYGDRWLEEGRIKSWNQHVVWVVYKCDGQWDRYDEFTAAPTDPRDLEFKE
jgi:hypothetical protein